MTTADAKLRIGADVGQARSAVKGLQTDVSSMNGAVKSGQERIEKLATAVTGASSVLGGMGAKAGAAAGAVSNLAMAFIAGGPLLAGLALATTGVAALVAELQNIQKDAHQADGSFKALADSMQQTAREKIAATAKSVAELDDRLRNFGMSATEVQLAKAEARDASLRLGIEGIESNLPGRRSRLASLEAELQTRIAGGVSGGKTDWLKEQVRTEREVVSSMAERLRLRKEELEVTGRQISLLQDYIEITEAARKAGTGRGGGRSRTRAGDGFVGPNISPAELERRRNETFAGQELALAFEEMDAEQKARKKHDKEMLKSIFEREKERTRILSEETKERERIEQDHVALVQKAIGETLSFMQSFTSQMFGTMLDVMEQLAAGQQVAIAEIAAAFVRTIGTQIFGIGLRTTAEGLSLAASALIPGNQAVIPAAVAHIATGGSLMVTGGAMAASGAIASGMLSRGSASGTGGGALAGGSLSPRDRGDDGPAFASGRGAITINFNGGTQLGDPTERATTMARDQRRVTRNVFLPEG